MRHALSLLLLLGAGCFDHGPDDPVHLGRMGKLFGNLEGLETVESPDRVEAFKLRPPTSSDAVPRYNRWPVIGSAVRVPADVAAKLSRGLTRESTYPRWDDPKGCDPRPGYMLRFTGGGRTVDVVLCFECEILFTYRGTESIWYANIDESTKTIASLLLKVFPADAELKRLSS